MGTKSRYESGTFWGALGGALAGAAHLVVGIKTGNVQMIGEGALGLFGFFTAWRLRKGQGVGIQ